MWSTLAGFTVVVHSVLKAINLSWMVLIPSERLDLIRKLAPYCIMQVGRMCDVLE